MPNGPSRNALRNRCAIYPYVASQDADAGNLAPGNYPAASATGVPCSFQRLDAAREQDESGRLSVHSAWEVFFASDPGVALNARLDLLAPDGVTVLRSVYATAAIDGGGRGQSWQVPCVERA